jgi:hypothetical protein
MIKMPAPFKILLSNEKNLIWSKSSRLLLMRLHQMRNERDTTELSGTFAMDRAGVTFGFWPS